MPRSRFLTVAPGRLATISAALAIAILCNPAGAQELAPRAYWPGPTGTKVVSLGYGYTDGDVLVDPAIPVESVDNKTQSLALSYYQIFGLAGRTAGLAITLPAATATIRADLGSDEVSRTVSGMSDLKVRLGINLIGAPAMTPPEFKQWRKNLVPRILGASLKIQLPTGEYNNDRVANIGTSRWAMKPELGYIEGLGTRDRWGLEMALGVWIYGKNDSFLGDRLEQEPMLSAEAHLVRLLPGAKWASIDLNYYQGGQTTREGVTQDNRQRNSRYGFSFVFPIKRHQIRTSFSNSWEIEEGGDYLTLAVSYSYVWN